MRKFYFVSAGAPDTEVRCIKVENVPFRVKEDGKARHTKKGGRTNRTDEGSTKRIGYGSNSSSTPVRNGNVTSTSTQSLKRTMPTTQIKLVKDFSYLICHMPIALNVLLFHNAFFF